LIKVHKLPRTDARDLSLQAVSVNSSNVANNNYYEDVSSDDDVLDIIADVAEVNETAYNSSLQDFDLNVLDPTSGKGEEQEFDLNVSDSTSGESPCDRNNVHDNSAVQHDDNNNGIFEDEALSEDTVIVVDDSGYDVSLETRSKKTNVEVWSRTVFKFTSYEGDIPVHSYLRYEDDYYTYLMKN
jgi:hypothetical protein